jgi:hypothetical protein
LIFRLIQLASRSEYSNGLPPPFPPNEQCLSQLFLHLSLMKSMFRPGGGLEKRSQRQVVCTLLLLAKVKSLDLESVFSEVEIKNAIKYLKTIEREDGGRMDWHVFIRQHVDKKRELLIVYYIQWWCRENRALCRGYCIDPVVEFNRVYAEEENKILGNRI